MAWTLGNLVSTVQTEIKDSAISTSTLKEWYNDTIRDLAIDKKWRFFEKSQDFTLVVGTASIGSLPSDLQVPNTLTNTTVGFEGKLAWTTQNDLEEDYPAYMNAENGKPDRVYEYGGTIQVFPKPDSAYTTTLTYQGVPAEQTDDAAIPPFTEDFREVIKLGMRKRFYFYRDKEDKAAQMQGQIDEKLISLARRYGPKQIGQNRMMRSANRSSTLVR